MTALGRLLQFATSKSRHSLLVQFISELVANITSEQVAVFGRKTQNAVDVTIQIQSPYVRRLHRLGTASAFKLP